MKWFQRICLVAICSIALGCNASTEELPPTTEGQDVSQDMQRNYMEESMKHMPEGAIRKEAIKDAGVDK